MQTNKFSLIIEGCDLSGKSTLLEALKNKFGSSVCVKNMVKPKNDSEEETLKLEQHYKTMLTFSDKLFVIYDRFFPSQSCYKFKRDGGKPMVIDEWIMELDKETAKKPSLLVILEEETKILEERFKRRGEDFVKLEELDRIKQNYRQYAEETNLPVLFVSTLNNLENSVNQIIDKVNEIINNWEGE